MEFTEFLKPEAISGVATLFVIGFVFRHVEGTIRGRRKESDLHSTILAVSWSIVLLSLIRVLEKPVPPSVDEKYHQVISLASYIIFAALMGVIVGLMRLAVPRIIPFIPAGYSQAVVNVLQSSKGAYVEVLVDEQWWSGMIWQYDRDPERFLDLHFTLRHPAKLVGGEWIAFGAEETLFCIKDVKMINRLPIGE